MRSLWEKEEGYFIYAKFDKCFISMLVDTGASVSILSKKQFDSWDMKGEIIPVRLNLLTATGESSPFYGKVFNWKMFL